MKLSNEDKYFINDVSANLSKPLQAIKRAEQFKVDDFLILHVSHYGSEPMKTLTNSYGAPVKFRVVHIDEKTGIPFVKRTNRNGNPTGPISSCIGIDGDEYYTDSRTNFLFELDPDYADSILLQDNYDPASMHRSRQETWKAITEHNKAHKIDTTDVKNIINLFDSVSAGDTLWTSSTGFYVIQDKKVMSKNEFNKNAKWSTMTNIAGHTITVLTIKDKKGNVKTVAADFFRRRALYTACPRSYKELNI